MNCTTFFNFPMSFVSSHETWNFTRGIVIAGTGIRVCSTKLGIASVRTARCFSRTAGCRWWCGDAHISSSRHANISISICQSRSLKYQNNCIFKMLPPITHQNTIQSLPRLLVCHSQCSTTIQWRQRWDPNLLAHLCRNTSIMIHINFAVLEH